MSNGAASFVTVASPAASFAIIARRVGSASAANVLLSWSERIQRRFFYITRCLYKRKIVECQISRRENFELYISQFVLDEAADGDPEAARERLLALRDLPVLDLTEEVGDLAAALVTTLALPARAATDAAHIAIAAVHGMHFLLTWNCTHIANAEMAVAIETACRERSLACPVICTPEELMGV